MGLFSFNVNFPKSRPTLLLLFFLLIIFHLIYLVILFLIPSSWRSSQQSSQRELNQTGPQHEDGWPEPVPLFFIIETIKDNLHVSEYHSVFARGSETCVVCLNNMEECDEVRRLVNCCHVFHKDCIDGWINKGKKTCPVCRSDLIPGQVLMSPKLGKIHGGGRE